MPRKLLLADDSVTIQRVIELTFADEDIQVIAVGDGRQAIERLERERPDIILADVGMPERDGYEVAAFVKSNPAFAQIPVVLLTGAFEPIDESRARAVGCDGVLVKPFEPQMVISRVRDLLAGRRPTTSWSAAPPAQGPVRQGPADLDLRQPGAVPPPGGDSLEAYFDRLDAAFSAGDTTAAPPAAASASAPAPPAAAPARPTAPPPAPAATPHDEVAAWDPDLTGDPTPSTPVTTAAPTPPPAWPPAAPPAPAPAAPSAAPAAWQAPPPEPASTAAPTAPVTPPSLVEAFAALLTAEQRNPISAPATAPAPALDEQAIDEIARRVLSRFEDQSMRPVVLEVAERLVREEIERLKQNR